jgi:hypothetical protein
MRNHHGVLLSWDAALAVAGPATGHDRHGWAAVAVGDQLDSRGSALLWSWPFGRWLQVVDR